ncbi:hypothetical protein O3P69_002330 [Scylla paramamosain]|uniref:Uncharacterized protein n=1 Tax=Scylla paramamosain TaxID=85552 RepID=A0AAW0V686_SCYPA
MWLRSPPPCLSGPPVDPLSPLSMLSFPYSDNTHVLALFLFAFLALGDSCRTAFVCRGRTCHVDDVTSLARVYTRDKIARRLHAWPSLKCPPSGATSSPRPPLRPNATPRLLLAASLLSAASSCSFSLPEALERTRGCSELLLGEQSLGGESSSFATLSPNPRARRSSGGVVWVERRGSGWRCSDECFLEALVAWPSWSSGYLAPRTPSAGGVQVGGAEGFTPANRKHQSINILFRVEVHHWGPGQHGQ